MLPHNLDMTALTAWLSQHLGPNENVTSARRFWHPTRREHVVDVSISDGHKIRYLLFCSAWSILGSSDS